MVMDNISCRESVMPKNPGIRDPTWGFFIGKPRLEGCHAKLIGNIDIAQLYRQGGD